MVIFVFFVFLLSFLSVCVNYDYYIKCVICIELMMFSLVFFIYFVDYVQDWLLIYVLIIGVCDGILGLLVIIFLIGYYGVDYYSVSNYDGFMY